MRVVITGASGFIGRALVDAIATDGNAEAIAVARGPLRTHPNVECIRVENYASSPGGDALVHLAEDPVASAPMQFRDLNLLEALLDGRYRRAIYGSSQLLYGDATDRPHDPSEPVIPFSPYVKRKRRVEERVLATGGAVARFANVYGPGMTEGTVISDILAQVPGAGPVSVGNGDAVRDFVWISDVAAGLAAMAQGTATGIFNLGTGIGTSVRDLARIALELAGESSRPVVSRSCGSSTIVVDAGGTTDAFGWSPQVSLTEGLAQMMEITR